MKISWAAFWVWIGIDVVLNGIVGIEELGITHIAGQIPITWIAVADPRLFVAIEIGLQALAAWWLIHWYRRKYGDLKPK